jgi:hypothetical protein
VNPIPTLFPIGLAMIILCPTGSHISNQFLAQGLFIALTIEAASTSETSVDFYQTKRHNIPEDILRTRHRENLKSHMV